MKRESVCRTIVIIFSIALLVGVEARPRYIECTDSLECGMDSCCVLGGGRFSLPRCLSLGKINDPCRPIGHVPLNATVNYPDGESVDLTNVYSIMCQCQPGLFCSIQSTTCQDPSDEILLNTIY